MSERTYITVMFAVVAICSFVFGVGVGNWATRQVLQMNQRQMLASAPSGFCSVDGKTWFKARADGMCYAVDEPR